MTNGSECPQCGRFVPCPHCGDDAAASEPEDDFEYLGQTLDANIDTPHGRRVYVQACGMLHGPDCRRELCVNVQRMMAEDEEAKEVAAVKECIRLERLPDGLWEARTYHPQRPDGPSVGIVRRSVEVAPTDLPVLCEALGLVPKAECDHLYRAAYLLAANLEAETFETDRERTAEDYLAWALETTKNDANTTEETTP